MFKLKFTLNLLIFELMVWKSPLLSNFLKISRSSNDEKRKGGQKEGDVEVEVDEVDEKQ